MDFTSDDEVIRIGRGLVDRTLPKAEWTHRAHFAATVWLLKCRSEIDIASEMPAMIRSYNEATGGVNSDTAGYHETSTQASIRAARAFLAGNDRDSLAGACNALMASELGKPGWILVYWSRERLFSVAARRSWIEPDVAELPF